MTVFFNPQEINSEFGNNKTSTTEARREMPIWIAETTISTAANDAETSDIRITSKATELFESEPADAGAADNEDEITSLLLRHEKRGVQTSKAQASTHNESDSDNK